MPVYDLSSGVDLLNLHRAHPDQYPVLLESALTGTPQARYDILFCTPQRRLYSRAQDDHFLNALDSALAEEPALEDPELSKWPFRGGWFVYLGYEMAQQIEPSLGLPPAVDGLPVALAIRFQQAIIRDHETQRDVLISETELSDDWLSAFHDQCAAARKSAQLRTLQCVVDEADDDIYRHQFRRVQEYIAAGDVFQVNLSRAWHSQCAEELEPAALYEALRAANPAPFAALMVTPEGSVVSSSPERLVSVQNGRIDTRPIAGTRPRGKDEYSDAQLSQELIGHLKERAEHVMLLDLERNDLGRVCVPGSIEVDELMQVESYAHVHHIVSNVTGRLLPDITPGQVLSAVFPGGTITGCPKVRCMEILAELEQQGRGAYTGSLGYVNLDGSMDFNILIRSMTLSDGQIHFRTGGGIVADSQCEAELEETRHKARGLRRALGDDSD